MLFSYNFLKDYLKGENFPLPQEFVAPFMAKSFEVEKIAKKEDDFVLDIDIKPNRAPDLLSHLGLARECAAVFDLELAKPETKVEEGQDKRSKDFISVEVEDAKTCPRYIAKAVEGVKVAPSPDWMKKRLEACGVQSINNIVDIVNYVMLELGQPLHAFDLEKLEGANLKVRLAMQGEKITTLDGKSYELDPSILVIADSQKAVAIAGVKGGRTAEISETTKTVILEAANFERIIIRKASQKLKLRTEASWRFENGIDPNMAELAINRAAFLIKQIAGGEAPKGIVDVYPEKTEPKIIYLEMSHINRLLGISVPKEETLKSLRKLEFQIMKDLGQAIEVKVPTFRMDVSLPEDLIEEIGRLYGYEKIPAAAPISHLIPAKKNLEIFWEEFVKDILKESDFTEVYNYSFIDQEKAGIFGYQGSEIMELENPLSDNQKYLVPSLIPNILENIRQNFRYFEELKIFELGKVFIEKDSESDPLRVQRRMFTGALASKDIALADDLFYQAKGVVDLITEQLGISNVWYDNFEATADQSKALVWHKIKRAEIKIGDEEVGFLGQVSDKILQEMKIVGSVVLFDVNFEKLQKLSSEEHEYEPLSPYPASIRDIAVLVPQNVLVEEVLNKIETAGGTLVRDVDLFDIYEGEELEGGKKNLAFHIIYQAQDRTLNAEGIDAIHQKITQSLEEDPEWEVRK